MSHPEVEVTIDGATVRVRRGTSVAAAILNCSGGDAASWAPLCGMGICWGCRVSIDGGPEQRACLVLATAGMTIRTVS